MYAATPRLDVLMLLAVKHAMRKQERSIASLQHDDDKQSVMIHVDVHRPHSDVRAGLDTHIEVDPTEKAQLVKAMCGTRKPPSARQVESDRVMREVKIAPGPTFLSMFYFDEVTDQTSAHW